MENQGIQQLVASICNSRVPFIQILRNGDRVPSSAIKQKQTSGFDFVKKLPPDNKHRNLPCHFCGTALPKSDLTSVSNIADKRNLVKPFENNHFHAMLCCKVCHKTVVKLKHLSTTSAKLNEELRNLVVGLNAVIKYKQGLSKSVVIKKIPEFPQTIEVPPVIVKTEMDIPSVNSTDDVIKVEKPNNATTDIFKRKMRKGFTNRESVKRKARTSATPKSEKRGKSTYRKTQFCPLCKDPFESGRAVDDHFSRVHPGQNQQCSHCKKEFARHYRLLNHIKMRHTKEVTPFRCAECGAEFERADYLRKHEFRHKIGNKLGKIAGNEHMMDICCPICSKSFRSALSVDKHFKFKHSGNQLKCQFCASFFSSFSCYCFHQNRVHKFKKGIACFCCRKKFSSPENLEAHVKTRHTPFRNTTHENKKWKCKQCPRKFKRMSQLLEHVKVKHKGKRYKCRFCELTYSSPNEVKKHEKLSHSQGKGEDPMRCGICYKVFNDEVYLSYHLELHKKRSTYCFICKKELHNRIGIKTHSLRKHKLKMCKL